MPKPNGAVIYRGPSMLDGAPIVVIATGLAKGSSNEKTGNGLVQTWIIREDVSPTDAVNSGADASVCGGCVHRGRIENGRNVGRSCYVTVFQAPLNVWKSYHRGIYADATNADLGELFAGRGVRLGSYGDPAAVPLSVWSRAMARAAFHTGYTHQWSRFPEMAQWCMASCDTPSERIQAKMLGFRTFRVRGVAEIVEEREIVCPASKEAGFKTTCDLCKACGGLTAKAKADVVIAAHGSVAKINAFTARQ